VISSAAGRLASRRATCDANERGSISLTFLERGHLCGLEVDSQLVLGIEIHITRAVSDRRTNVFQKLMPHFLASLEESYRQRIRVGHWFDVHGT
jgi:hypothetical protein